MNNTEFVHGVMDVSSMDVHLELVMDVWRLLHVKNWPLIEASRALNCRGETMLILL